MTKNGWFTLSPANLDFPVEDYSVSVEETGSPGKILGQTTLRISRFKNDWINFQVNGLNLTAGTTTSLTFVTTKPLPRPINTFASFVGLSVDLEPRLVRMGNNASIEFNHFEIKNTTTLSPFDGVFSFSGSYQSAS